MEITKTRMARKQRNSWQQFLGQRTGVRGRGMVFQMDFNHYLFYVWLILKGNIWSKYGRKLTLVNIVNSELWLHRCLICCSLSLSRFHFLWDVYLHLFYMVTMTKCWKGRVCGAVEPMWVLGCRCMESGFSGRSWACTRGKEDGPIREWPSLDAQTRRGLALGQLEQWTRRGTGGLNRDRGRGTAGLVAGAQGKREVGTRLRPACSAHMTGRVTAPSQGVEHERKLGF